MTREEAFYTAGGIFVTAALAGVALTLTLVNGRDWAQRHAKLERELTQVKVELRQWRELGTTPSVLSRALNNYSTIHDTLLLAESGRAYKSNINEVTQCFTVEVPWKQRPYAGL